MPKLVQLSPLQQHLNRWKNCSDCPLCETRKHVVLCRGTVPCSILLIGEAPGPSEDNRGSPFIGPAGRLLDRIIAQSIPPEIDLAFTNLVACLPTNVETGKKFAEPPEESIKACSGRLLEFIRICQPKAIIGVGVLAKKWIPFQSDTRYEFIIHPAAILRADITKQELMARRCAVALEEVARSLG